MQKQAKYVCKTVVQNFKMINISKNCFKIEGISFIAISRSIRKSIEA